MKISSFLIALSQWLPLFVFLLFARFYEMTDDLWRQAFYVSSACAIVVTALLIYKKITIDRLRFGINLFLMTGAFAFLIESESILRFFDAYEGVVFFGGIFVVGLFTTFFSPLGFIGIAVKNKQQLQKMSLLLLGATMVALVWSFLMNDHESLVSIVVPFIVLTLFRKKLIDVLLQEKDEV
jgi:hypothetical protein